MKKRIRTNILVATWFLLILNIGLIITIDNSILSIIYALCLIQLGFIIGKRIEVI